jgi:hypothetical protein
MNRHKKGNAVKPTFPLNYQSARRDSNPKAPEKAHKIKEECALSSNCLQNEDTLNRIYKPTEIV